MTKSVILRHISDQNLYQFIHQLYKTHLLHDDAPDTELSHLLLTMPMQIHNL